jgi:hypothetical protein
MLLFIDLFSGFFLRGESRFSGRRQRKSPAASWSWSFKAVLRGGQNEAGEKNQLATPDLNLR